jgi:PPOX class probable F420-dependent enzyme
MAGARPRIADSIKKIVKEARVARFATIDAKSRPHMVPICFAFDGKVFYSAIDRKPKRVAPERLARVKNLSARSDVALLVDHYEEDWTQLWFVLIQGKAKLLAQSARQERTHAIAQLRAKYVQYSQGMLADDAPIIRITPQRITSWGKIRK